jgi:hypothetical protein
MKGRTKATHVTPFHTLSRLFKGGSSYGWHKSRTPSFRTEPSFRTGRATFTASGSPENLKISSLGYNE